MQKGQMAGIGEIGVTIGIAVLVIAVFVLVITNFSSKSVPVQTLTAENSTTLNVLTTPTDKTHWIDVSEYYNDIGVFKSGTLTTTIVDAGAKNYTIQVNTNLLTIAGGINTSSTYDLTSAQLVNGKNNITYNIYNTTNISQSSLTIKYETQGDQLQKNILATSLSGYGEFGGYIGLVVIVAIMSLILLWVMGSFGGRTSRTR